MFLLLNRYDLSNTEETKKVAKAQEELIEFVCQQIGISCQHPTLDPATWPPPTGQVPFVPLKRPMRMDLEEIMETDESKKLNYERGVNLFQIHKCKFAYCLKEISKKRAQEEENVIEEDGKSFKCRFNFPQETFGFNVTTEQGPNGDFITESRFSGAPRHGASIVEPPKPVGDGALSTLIGKRNLEIARNHPYVGSHVKELALGFCSNSDTQLIKSESQCRRYLSKYLNKEEGASHTQKKVMKAVGSKLNETSSVKSAIKSLLIQSTTREVCRQEAVMMINRNDEFMKFSLKTRRVCIGDTRRLNLDVTNPDARAFNDSGWQVMYFNRETDTNFLNAVKRFEEDPDGWKTEAHMKLPNYKNVVHPRQVNLHHYCAFFKKNWQFVNEEHFPVFSPVLRNVNPNNKELFEDFCKYRLLQFKAGSNPSNVLEGFGTYEDCLKDFIDKDSNCPTIVKEEYDEALLKRALQTKDMPEDDNDQFLDVSYEDLHPGLEGEMFLI